MATASEKESCGTVMLVFDLTTGISWSAAYIAAIILGFRNRTWCIPKLSICMNFSWELLVVVNRLLQGSFGIPFFIQLTWLMLDIAIVFTWLIFDSRKIKLFQNLLLFIVVLFIMYVWAYRMSAWGTTVFLVNLLMSAEFIYRRTKDHTPWTSRFVAVAKMIGTFSATILNGAIGRNPQILLVGGICFILDLYYMVTFIPDDSFL